MIIHYKHDCEHCRHLGEIRKQMCDGERAYDLYFCLQGINAPTVIARYGDDEPEYYSGMRLAEHPAFPELAEAKRLAIEAGYFRE